jgi:alcohol dehydrogenase
MSDTALPQTALASVFCGPGQPLELRSFALPTLAAGELLVRVDCSTLCGSDLHTYLGRRHGPTPTVLGHEAVGRIAAFGQEHSQQDWRGAPLEIGDRVSWSVAASCGECFFCRHELPQKCARLFKYGHQSCDGGHPLSGGLAEYCHLAAGSAVVRVPEEIPDAVASSANCAFATVAAALRTAGGCENKCVLIQGAGLLGLAAAALASVSGAAHVLVADVDDARLTQAERFGATATFNVAHDAERLTSEVARLTDGRGVDVAIEMSGTLDAFKQGLGLLRTGGRYVLVGAVRPIGTASLDVEQVVRKMWRIEGVHNYAPVDLAAAIDFLAAHHARFPFRELVTATHPLEEVGAAFDEMLRTKAVRVAVCPHGK